MVNMTGSLVTKSLTLTQCYRWLETWVLLPTHGRSESRSSHNRYLLTEVPIVPTAHPLGSFTVKCLCWGLEGGSEVCREGTKVMGKTAHLPRPSLLFRVGEFGGRLVGYFKIQKHNEVEFLNFCKFLRQNRTFQRVLHLILSGYGGSVSKNNQGLA